MVALPNGRSLTLEYETILFWHVEEIPVLGKDGAGDLADAVLAIWRDDEIALDLFSRYLSGNHRVRRQCRAVAEPAAGHVKTQTASAHPRPPILPQSRKPAAE